MNGLALSRSFYETIGKPALEQQFPALMSRMAIGLAGEGSECLGFDDELSRDHDWGPAFCIWLEKEDYIIFKTISCPKMSLNRISKIFISYKL